MRERLDAFLTSTSNMKISLKIAETHFCDFFVPSVYGA